MKASELQLPEGVEVYVDMDGVLADFFSEYAKLAGVKPNKFGKHDYRSIPPAKTDPTLDKMIGTDFFARLLKFPTADKLLSIVVDAAGSYNICSSPLRGDHEGSAKYKKIWIENELSLQPKQIFIVTKKAKYAKNANGMPNVLIDDRSDNITAWEAAGGIGIKYQADEDSLKVILDGLKRARRVVQGDEQHEPQNLTSLDRGKMISTPQESIEQEGWKDTIAGAALATGLAFGGGANAAPVKQMAVQGDTVYSIARQNNVSPTELFKLNNFDKDTKLTPGQSIKVPSTANNPDADPLGTLIQHLSNKDKDIIQQVQKRIQHAPKKTQVAKPYEPITGSKLETALYNFAVNLGVKGVELAAFMGQTAHESDNFKTTKEYSSGQQYEGRKDLGNVRPGDGEKYKGRGFIQITGRYNYTLAAKALGIDLVNHPELAEKPDVAAKVTWWYWQNRVRPNVGNFNDVKQVTKTINPGLKGLAKRKAATRNFKMAQL